jgi:hypothetical protein
MELVFRQQEFHHLVAQPSIFRRTRLVMLDDGVRHSMQQVGTTDDTDQPPLLEHRDVLDAMPFQKMPAPDRKRV